MRMVQFRGFAAQGIHHDPSPYELPQQAFSGGANVRFHANKVERAPVFKTFLDGLPDSPIYATVRQVSSGIDSVFTVSGTGAIRRCTPTLTQVVSPAYTLFPQITNGGSGYLEGSPPAVTVSAPQGGGTTATAVSSVNAAGAVVNIVIEGIGSGYTASPTLTIAAPPSTATSPAQATATCAWSAFTPSNSPAARTSTFLGDVTYINDPSGQPCYYGPTSTAFAPLPDWNPAWSCRSLRCYGDYLVALNVTKGAVTTPSMVKWSDLTLAGLPPGSWDANDLTTSSGENIIEELLTPLVDGAPMRSIFVFYSEDQIFSMAQNGTQEIFSFTRLFGDGGLLAPNCAVEVDGIHYCFGPKDIYQHDGLTKLSLIDGKNRDYVYGALDTSKSERCFAFYSQQFKSIFFCYCDISGDAAYQGTPFPNRAAVYDISSQSWSFIDLPNCPSGFVTSVDAGVSWASLPSSATWATATGPWTTAAGRYTDTPVFASAAFPGAAAKSRILAYDFANKGSLGGLQVPPESNPPAMLERVGMALDTEGSDLATYKTVRRVYPLIDTYAGTSMQIQVGGSLSPSGAVTWGPVLSFDPATQYKVDCRVGGRYLAFRILAPSVVDFAFVGFDLDITSAGRR